MMKIFVAIFLLTGFVITTQAQQYDPDKINRKAKAFFEQAYALSKEGEYEKSIQALKDAIKIEPGFLDAWLSIAGVYGEMKDYTRAIEYYEKARSMDSAWFRDYNLPYSISLAGKGEFQKALEAIDHFLSNPGINATSQKAGNYRKKTYQFAIEYANQHPMGNYTFKPENLGDSINSNSSEYFPALTLDAQELIFTRRENLMEDFFGSKKVNGQWIKAKRLTGQINSNRRAEYFAGWAMAHLHRL
jgi:tetratricopeptide (TPR) repeat protein